MCRPMAPWCDTGAWCRLKALLVELSLEVARSTDQAPKPLRVGAILSIISASFSLRCCSHWGVTSRALPW
jgi:hypothetical protein